MRFSLQDVKKKVQRRGGTLSMTLGFLRPGEADEAIERLVDYHERLLGRPQRQFSADEARACIGDYRLADCLIATLSHWYSWRQRDWASVLLEMGADPERAGQMDCTSPVQLRLALYDYVNEQFQGFLDSQARAQALQGFADRYGLSAANLEYLLSLDSEGEALLVREAARPPEPVEVTTLYNQWAFEAALCNASSVYFVIDCRAFGLSSGIGLGIGAAIKRLVFLARKLGVYYDLAYEGTTASPAPPERLTLTLYGPQEVSGAPQQYGLRLARLCRLLLGYGSPKAANAHRRFASAIVEAEATVHFLQRSYQFSLNGQLLRLFPTHLDDERAESGSAAPVFDSGIEQSFGEAFVSLAGRQGLDGWSLEREPEPLL
ncbi:MAG: DUF790 family protein, partial [Ktedonobacteraceae bacterium]|nr:DUF790 family protein [Ktedonobacteraceae bacterium]